MRTQSEPIKPMEDLRDTEDLRNAISLCERETEVLEAVENGQWSDDLSRHTESCQACADTRLIAQLFAAEEALALDEAAHAVADPGRLPDADEIWRRAQKAEKRKAVERALWPIKLVERLAVIAAALAVVVAGSWAGSFLKPLAAPLAAPLVRGWQQIAGLFSGVPAAGSAVSSLQPSPGMLAVGCLGLVLVLLVVGYYRSWAER